MNDDETLEWPAIASAHGHAFQRALRGRAQRARGSFWSWRGLMYALAERATPEDLYAIARFAYAELAQSGVTAIGEFHYMHHQPDGTPYAERTLLADTMIRAARDAGLRITLLRVLYARAGLGRAPEAAQRRFFDARVEDALGDVQALRDRYRDDEHVRVGVAPHSVRAVPIEWIEEAARFARAEGLVLHMHVSEQRREIQECLAEHGLRPVELLADRGALGPDFCAVHATHLTQSEIALLRDVSVCVCRTTERDLGDGAPPIGPLVAAGARLCIGVDSHAASDPFEEARAIELDERTRTEQRAIVDASVLALAMGEHGYRAIGMASTGDRVLLDANDASLAGHDRALVEDAVVFGAGPRAVREVWVAGERIVEGSLARGLDTARQEYLLALSRLALR